MCGNGVRCVARHLAETRGLAGDLVIDTDSGPKRCAIHRDAAGVPSSVSVEMGPARVLGDEELRVAGETLRAVRVSMGNPHAAFDEPTRERASAIGPRSSGPSRAA